MTRSKADLRYSLLRSNEPVAVTGSSGQMIEGPGFMSLVTLISDVAATATFYDGTDNTGPVLRILKTLGGVPKVSRFLEFENGLFVEVT